MNRLGIIYQFSSSGIETISFNVFMECAEYQTNISFFFFILHSLFIPFPSVSFSICLLLLSEYHV